MEVNIYDFLQNIGEDELINREVLNTKRNLLNNKSVGPLIKLMKEKNISRLEFYERNSLKWFLQTDGQFMNAYGGFSRVSNGKSLANHGDIFLKANNVINPFYSSTKRKITSQIDWD